jgi:hypothetical protein
MGFTCSKDGFPSLDIENIIDLNLFLQDYASLLKKVRHYKMSNTKLGVETGYG